MRDGLVLEFAKNVNPVLSNIKSVALVGGKHDPELSIFDEKQITTFGIDGESEFLDLNSSNSEFSSNAKFDLVVCNQVLEHVWNHQSFFENLKMLVQPGGYLWITAPASNFVHSSPHYYSAGFTSPYLEKNLIKHGFEVVNVGELSSKRNYLMRHSFNLWLSAAESNNPLREIRSVLSKNGNRAGMRRSLALIVASLLPNVTDNSQRFAVESFVFARLP
jgi:SAM-dependent methyltransferase